MDNLFKLYMYHIDDLRIESKMTIGQLCEDVFDRRQYSRYINGTQIINQNRLNKLVEKLGLSQMDFIYSFYSKETSELKQITKIYMSLVSGRFDDVQIAIKKYDKHKFIGSLSKRIYELCKIEFNHEKKFITKYVAIEKFSNLIGYPECLSKKRFDFVDIVSLLYIMRIEFTLNKFTSLEFLEFLLEDTKYIYLSSTTMYILPSIYSNVCSYIARRGDFIKALKIAELGINYSIHNQNMHLLETLYYYKAYFSFKLGNSKAAHISALRSLSVLIAKNDLIEYKEFKDMIFKEMNFDIDSHNIDVTMSVKK